MGGSCPPALPPGYGTNVLHYEDVCMYSSLKEENSSNAYTTLKQKRQKRESSCAVSIIAYGV